MGKVKIEFEENNDKRAGFYELRTFITINGKDASIPYVKCSDDIAKKIGGDISTILESKGYNSKDTFIEINSKNLFRTEELLNLSIPGLLKKSLRKLNYKVNMK